MTEQPSNLWQVYEPGSELPGAITDLLGTHAADLFADADADQAAWPICLVAERRDAPAEPLAAALMLIEKDVDPSAPVGSIQQLVVPPRSRGRGFGPRLVREATRLARERGCGRVRSTAGWGCPDHLGMYYRMGFEPLSAREMPYLVSLPLTTPDA